MKIKFFRQIFKNLQITNFMKIRPVGAEFLRVDGQTDEANSRFPQFFDST